MTWKERLALDGIRRKRNGGGRFRYLRADGSAVSAADLARIRALGIPPAWIDVLVNPAPSGRVQALGTDKAGRLQYLYHADHEKRRERKKFERIVRFGSELPRLRRALAEDLRREGFDRRRVLASMVQILWTCSLRPGSREYARDNGSFGLATIQRRHVRVRGAVVKFEFPGKSGQHQTAEITDRRIARLVRQLAKAPGRGVFCFRDESGQWCNVRRRHLNDYIQEILGQGFSAKDFRTWAGSLACARALAAGGALNGEGPAEAKRRVAAAIRETARQLGNTPAVCRSAYIAPAVWQQFERGRILEGAARAKKATRREERALLKLLRGASPAAESASRRAA